MRWKRWPYLVACVLLTACNQGKLSVAAQGEKNIHDHRETDVEPGWDTREFDPQKAFDKTIKVSVMNYETGETKEVDAEMKFLKGERFIYYPPEPESQISLDGIRLVDADLKPYKIDLDKVTIIEYWSGDTINRNLYWNRSRELEQEFADRDDVQVISINYDTALSGFDQVKESQRILASYTKPKRLIYDLNDGFRDKVFLPGPLCYFLIDHRGQLTHIARGDWPDGVTLFDAIENALTFQRTSKQNFQVQYLDEEEQ